MRDVRQRVVEIITHTHKTVVEQADEILELIEDSRKYKQLCPKCSGQGIVSKPPHITGDQNEWTGCEISYQCNLCEGKMVI